ncbi:ig-like domain-containing protein [Trichonephila clavipes]|nr:ig-like domain-containing protein [Trichonephila clavipes]
MFNSQERNAKSIDTIDLERSNSSHVLLISTDLNSEGLYGCEVSGEAPSFSTAKSEDEMRIYGLFINLPLSFDVNETARLLQSTETNRRTVLD